MANSFLNIRDGINLNVTPNSPGPTELGDLTVNSASSNLEYFNGSVASDVATAANTLTLSGKTLTSPTINNATMVAPALGTPVSGVATNLTGTASGLTAGNVITNANLTGPITSSGNTTSVAAQTGTGSTFVMQASPTLTTPNLGTPSAVVLTNATGTAPGLTAGTVTTNANLTGDVTSSGNTTTVATVGTSTAANVHAAEVLANAATSSATASAIVKRDSNGNTQLNSLQENLVTNSSSTSLTSASAKYQTVSGPVSLNLTLPNATTLIQGRQFVFTNTGNGLVVKTNSGTTLMSVPPFFTLTVTLINNGSTDGTWTNNLGLISPSITTPIFRALDTATTLVTNSSTVVKFDSVTIDTNSSWNASTGVYTVKNAGYYQIDCNISVGSYTGGFPSSNSQTSISLYVNGSLYVNSANSAVAGNSQCLIIFDDIVQASVNDTFQIQVQTPNTAPAMFNPRLMIKQIPSVFYT